MAGVADKDTASGDCQRCSLEAASSIAYQVSFQNWPSAEFCFEATHFCFPMVRGFGDDFRFPERCTNSAETSRLHPGSWMCQLSVPSFYWVSVFSGHTLSFTFISISEVKFGEWRLA